MYAFQFPDMLGSASANLVKEKDAVRSDMLQLLSSEKGTLFGDPYYGCQLKKYLFEQSTTLVTDLLIDELYTTIVTFMPQAYIRRKDITVWTDKETIYADIKYHYREDSSSDLFTIKLTESAQED